MIRTLIIDDSIVIRKLLSKILNADPEIEVVGEAEDAYQAREMIKRLNPDVLTLDVEMPKMSGVDFLRNLMRLRPMPVVMISTLTEKGAKVTLEALALGAIEIVAKPKVDVDHGMDVIAEEITTKVKHAAAAKIFRPKATKPEQPAQTSRRIEDIAAGILGGEHPAKRLIAIGASTGGTEAIKDVLTSITSTTAGIVITQHIAAFISAQFAKRMNELSHLPVCQAEDGQTILSGHVYIAPGNLHLTVVQKGKLFKCKLVDSEPVHRCKPSVDVLFDSVAKLANKHTTGAILTGMGSDGATGLKKMKDAGAKTIAQDEETCVIFGMPKEAIKHGVTMVRPLDKIGPLLSDAPHQTARLSA